MINQAAIERLHHWLSIHREFDCEFAPDKNSPDWLCTINDSGESYVLSIEHRKLGDYLVISAARFPDLEDEGEALFVDLIKVCNRINGSHLGATCKVEHEYGIGVVFFAVLPLHLFMTFSDDEITRFVLDSFRVLNEMIDDYKRQVQR